MTNAVRAVTFPIIFAAPSGAGKTSIAMALRDRRQDVEFSISATTRPPRAGEQDGVDYHFLSRDEFREMADRGELLEWAEVHGNLYGTPRRNVEEAVERGHYLILDIDVQGSRQVRAAMPTALAIFVLPPSGQELARRLRGRGSEREEVQIRRLRAARDELQAVSEFDYVIVNREMERSVDEVEEILRAEAYRTERIPELARMVQELTDQVDRHLGALGS